MKDKSTYRQLESQLRAPSLSAGQRIMALLADEWKSNGPPGILDIKAVAMRLAMPVDGVHEAIAPLYQKGLVDCDRSRTAVFLTPQGYEVADATRLPFRET